MMPHDHPAIDLLDQMHRAILCADFAILAQLTPQLEAAMPAPGPGQNPRILAGIKSRAERNALCLTAAARGVRAAQRRLAELQNRDQGFSTYDGRGKKANHGPGGSLQLRY
jgi:hypothetical protein